MPLYRIELEEKVTNWTDVGWVTRHVEIVTGGNNREEVAKFIEEDYGPIKSIRLATLKDCS